MKLTFLGVASALSDGHNSNMLLDTDEGYTLLIDCGETIKASLRDAERKVEEIDGIYISHLHSDHCFGLCWLGYYSYFILKRKIALSIHESLVDDLWQILSPAMSRLDKNSNVQTLATYFNVRVVADYNPRFMFSNVWFELVKNYHVNSDAGNMYSYGLKVIDPISKKRIYISTDSDGECIKQEIRENNYDMLFHDCDVMNLNGPHINYDKLDHRFGLSDEVKKKMWLYHYTDLGDKMPDAVADGFAGFVEQGQVFEI